MVAINLDDGTLFTTTTNTNSDPAIPPDTSSMFTAEPDSTSSTRFEFPLTGGFDNNDDNDGSSDDNYEAAFTEEPDGLVGHHNSAQRTKTKNSNFADVDETGTWGNISRKEIIAVVGALLFLVAGVVVAVVLLVGDGNSSNNNSTDPSSNLAAAGASGGGSGAAANDVIYSSPAQQYKALVSAVASASLPAAIATEILRNMPQTVQELGPDEEDAYAAAAYWLVNTDPIAVKRQSELLPRFVLAVTYVRNGGITNNWNFSKKGSAGAGADDDSSSNNKWLSSSRVCDWNGIRCNAGTKQLIEVDLSVNGLTGSMHVAWALLEHCTSLLLNENMLNGPIPGVALGNMPKLTYLYLQENQFTGTIPASLKDTGTLDTLFLQGNDALTGVWPIEFCPNSANERPFREFGLNCKQVECFCCAEILNCFN